MRNYYKRFMKDASKDKRNSLLTLANEVDFPPVMMARIILEQHLIAMETFGDVPIPKGHITKLLRNPVVIGDKFIVAEVEQINPVSLILIPNFNAKDIQNEAPECVSIDENCGPENDAIKSRIGLEYEEKLNRLLDERDIHYLGEDDLRNLGYDKTPDVRLHVPIAVNGYVINWIESKASFGDPESHNGYLANQFWSYCNRFGPGLVIYWFGYVDELDSNQNRGIMLSHGLPDTIVTLDMLL